ncbi:hypothetical protein D305_gp09 [Pseudomonas phage UFV-P2]|uniref:Uncharacterized protein n=1 Tax=Pseudomonas phage UFV-P2 TaxID=1235661 RepID=M4T212_9CAUD|nr:hypothetical protein D305_gp09 [Pseudomonas phage UFV-P2]AGH62706.1 hypothetical protein [Pseudomonas phage UFV-P2]
MGNPVLKSVVTGVVVAETLEFSRGQMWADEKGQVLLCTDEQTMVVIADKLPGNIGTIYNFYDVGELYNEGYSLQTALSVTLTVS